ncbi:MAG: fluoride efflux transporter CrcB [Burkholderiales bacterium]|nr:fluoride efflux transporter CrcB [Phycisphaerae bacterium]
MNQLILVGVGGAIGSVARWKLGALVQCYAVDWKFPLGTFLINVLGCLIAGVLAGLTTKLGMFTAETRLFLFTGLMGGFTTFSAFGLETVTLLRRAEYSMAVLYVLLSVMCGVGALWLGWRLIRGDAAA